MAGKALVAQINVDENHGLSARYGIRGIPAVLLMQKGRVVETMGGSRDLNSILAWFKRHFPD
jgi:thioredoxin 2